MANLHFVANLDAKKRLLIKMGEREEIIFNVGCPRIDYINETLDRFKAGKLLTSEELFKNFKRGLVENSTYWKMIFC